MSAMHKTYFHGEKSFVCHLATVIRYVLSSWSWSGEGQLSNHFLAWSLIRNKKIILLRRISPIYRVRSTRRSWATCGAKWTTWKRRNTAKNTKPRKTNCRPKWRRAKSCGFANSCAWNATRCSPTRMNWRRTRGFAPVANRKWTRDGLRLDVVLCSALDFLTLGSFNQCLLASWFRF